MNDPQQLKTQQQAPAQSAATTPEVSLYRRLMKSKRVRLFFAISILLHIIFAIALSTNQRLHDMMFSKGGREPERERTQLALERAIEALNGLNHKRFTQSLHFLVDIRAQVDALQNSKMMRMKEEDADRKQKIEAGAWPSAEQPNKTVKYFARIDEPLPKRFNLDPLPDLRKLSLVEMYDRHRDLEQEVGYIYERFHALELSESLEDPIPLSQAIKNTRMSLPKRRDPDMGALTAVIDCNERFDAYKKELQDLFLETQDMVNMAKRWLELAQMKDRGGLDLAHMFGTAYNVAAGPAAYFGHFLNPRLLKRVTTERLIDPACVLGNAIGKSDLTLNGPDPKDPEVKPEWLAVDRWYYVGPFDHPGAQRRMADLERKYPPERDLYNVNIDETYQGKADKGGTRILRWKYRHVGTDFIEKGIKFEPFSVDNGPYAIWYFYTVVWSDEDRTVLGSFASDDYGVCWVNGQRIYQSPPDTTPWVPFTKYGFRPVPLRKGFNKFMFKLENAQGTTGFSVILMTYEDKDLIQSLKDIN